MGIDYYGVMSLTRLCTQLDVKQRYRELALQLHPLRKPYPPMTPKPVISPPNITWHQLGEAFDVLSDPLLREVFDQYGEEGLKKGVPAPGGFVPPYKYHGDPMLTYNEFFGSISPYADLLDAVGNPIAIYDLPEGRGVKSKDKLVIQPLLLTLNEVYHGGLKKMKIQRLVFVDEQCIQTELREKILNVPIRRGILPGTHIKFNDAGDQCATKEPADIIFVTADRPHARFTREGIHLCTTEIVSLKDALCGTSVTINTLDERIIRVPITGIIDPEFEKIVVGEGMPRTDDHNLKGDLIIRFKIMFPKYLPKASKVLVARAFVTAEKGGPCETPDNVHRQVLKDKMNRINPSERLPY